MSLTAADVGEIMRLVEQSTFDELTLEVDGMKLCLRRGAAAALQSSASSPAIASPPAVALYLWHQAALEFLNVRLNVPKRGPNCVMMRGVTSM